MSGVFALGLDLGNRRIGVAGCDPTGLIATGLGVIHRRSLKADRQALLGWIALRQATQVIVGLPYLHDGSLGSQAHAIQRFMTTVDLGLPITYVDERHTTEAATDLLRALGIPPHQRRNLIDKTAARIILQDWLDHHLIRDRLRE